MKLQKQITMYIKLLYALILLGFTTVIANAQDKIYESNGNIIDAKIVKIIPPNIYYNKWGIITDSTLSINRKKVLAIRYENGTVDVMDNSIVKDTTSPIVPAQQYSYAKEYGHQLFSVNALSPVLDRVAIAYEIYNETGYCSFKIPITYNYKYKSPYVGLEIKFFPTQQGLVRMFVGPSVIIGEWPVIKTYSYYGQSAVISENFFAGLIKTGVAIQAVGGFNLTIDGGLGFVRFQNSSIKTSQDFILDVGLHLGYRF
jgi:hypothetical protein